MELNGIGGTGEFAFGDAIVLLLKIVAVYGSVVSSVRLAPDAEFVFPGFICRESRRRVSSRLPDVLLLGDLLLHPRLHEVPNERRGPHGGIRGIGETLRRKRASQKCEIGLRHTS